MTVPTSGAGSAPLLDGPVAGDTARGGRSVPAPDGPTEPVVWQTVPGSATRVPAPAAAPSRSGHPHVLAPAALPVVPREQGRRHRHRAPLAWLPWALLAALLVLLALVLAAGTLAGAQRTAGGATRGTATAGDAAAGDVAGAAGTGTGTGTDTGSPEAAAGTLTAGGTDLLADPSQITRVAGEQVEGRSVPVESVVADEGFWVGRSAQDRTFVFLTGQARESSGESGLQVRAGQRLDLEGVVAPLQADDPRTFGVDDDEGAPQLTTQGAYVRARQARLPS
jgi:hypothetical protein